jgi:chromatin segregation and condensation protein Rec8/ScpA/Scc1 (kleisin family)
VWNKSANSNKPPNEITTHTVTQSQISPTTTSEVTNNIKEIRKITSEHNEHMKQMEKRMQDIKTYETITARIDAIEEVAQTQNEHHSQHEVEFKSIQQQLDTAFNRTENQARNFDNYIQRIDDEFKQNNNNHNDHYSRNQQ